MQSWFTGDIDHAWIYKSQLQAAIDYITASAEEYYSAIEDGNIIGSESLGCVGADTVYEAIDCYLKLLIAMGFISWQEYESSQKLIKLPEDKVELHKLFLTKRDYSLIVRGNLESILYRWLVIAGLDAKRRELYKSNK